MLEHLIRIGTERGPESPTVVLLHGRGSDMHDLFSLAPSFPADWNVVSVQAPFPGMPWGYGPGWAWYRYLAADRVVDETLKESLHALDEVLAALPDLVGGGEAGGEPGGGAGGDVGGSVGDILLGGFSQGGTTSLAFALTRPGVVSGVLNFSGFLVDSPLVGVDDPPGSLPIFWGHGQMDPAIPYSLALKGRERLAAAGIEVETADHNGGHFITPQELEAAVAWVGQRASGTTPA